MSLGFPVVLSPHGTPVTSVESGAPYATVAWNGHGMPITLVPTGGVPMVLSTNPVPIVPGPLEVVVMEQGGFNDFSHEFELASDSVIVEFACTCTGNPVVEMEHAGEPLTILRSEVANGLMAVVACGRGLTQGKGLFTIKATGGDCNQGAVRINEMSDIHSALSGWEYGDSGTGIPLPQIIMENTNGGIVKGIFVNRGADHNHIGHVDGATTLFNGFFMAGEPIGQDFSVYGPWEIGEGWSIVGDKFVHTGRESGTLKITHTPLLDVSGCRARVNVESGNIRIKCGAGATGAGVGGFSIISTASTAAGGVGGTNTEITATGNCEIWDISVVVNGYSIAWVFFEAESVDGSVLQPVMAYRPGWVFNAVEVLGDRFIPENGSE